MSIEDLIKEARKCTTKEELLELAKSENFELCEEDIDYLLSPKNRNKELSDEELDYVSGGTCYSSDTYEELDIDPTCYQNSDNNPVIVTVGNSCRLQKRTCVNCAYGSWRNNASLYCRLRSKQHDPVDDPLYVYYPEADCIVYNEHDTLFYG